MADKSAARVRTPKGREYCDKPGTSCFYNERDVCVNCGRPKGWRARAVRCQNCKALMPPADDNPFNQICPNCSEPR